MSLAIVVMGVSGCGKTTVGRALARKLDARFIDGDDLHSDEARAKMKAGPPLNDDDRWPWLDRVGVALAEDADTIIACSALRRIYRDRLRAAAGPGLRFVYLEASREMMTKRVAQRKHHYMPASLVDSQFATLEPPAGEADVITTPADGGIETKVKGLISAISR